MSKLHKSATARRVLPLTGLLSLLSATADISPASATPYLGEIATFAFEDCPLGWEPLNGGELLIEDNPFLYELIGTSYGGDGETTFALPVGKPVFTADRNVMFQCISLFGILPEP